MDGWRETGTGESSGEGEEREEQRRECRERQLKLRTIGRVIRKSADTVEAS